LDISFDGLKDAKGLGLNALCASALDIPIRSNTADTILCLSLIEHLNEDKLLIKEITQLLKPGGILILTTPMHNGISFPFLSKSKNDALQSQWGHLRPGYSLDELKKMFEENNLTTQKINKYFNCITRLFYRLCFLSRLPLVGRFKLFHAIIRLEPYIKWGAQTHMLVARKKV
jgi:SAM-dependent methyltransferase